MGSQICLGITGSGLDECSGSGTIRGNDDLITDIVSENIVVFAEHVNSVNVEIQQVRRPSRGVTVN